MTLLTGKVIVITGGASGIGAATTRLCAIRGAHVVIGDVNDAVGTRLAQDLKDLGLSATFVHTDVVQEADCQHLMQSALDRHAVLDVLVASAGILQGAQVDAASFDLEVFQRVQDVNVRGTFLSLKHAVAAMGDRGGTILLLSSGAGVTGGSSSVAYGTSKAAIHGLGLAVQRHLGRRPIRVNTVCPGSISTPLKRQNVEDVGHAQGQSEAEIDAAKQALHDPEGVARVLAFLASDDAAAIHGTVFTH